MSSAISVGTAIERGKMETSSNPLSPEKLACISRSAIPNHVAIIPDGNRRWARKLAKSVIEGHRQGADALIPTVKTAKQLGIQSLTFYLFSTENWTRSSEEVEALMWLFEIFLIEQREEMLAEGVRFHAIGNLTSLPESLQQTVHETIEITKNGSCINLISALNYGARNELTRAFQKMVNDCLSGKIDAVNISENLIASYLDTTPWGDPDLFIRTSGERRLSNFMLWQLSYAELYLIDTLWPDFRPEHLWEAILYYQSRQKRLGG